MLDVDLDWVADAGLETLLHERDVAAWKVDEPRAAEVLRRDDVGLLMDVELLRIRLESALALRAPGARRGRLGRCARQG